MADPAFSITPLDPAREATAFCHLFEAVYGHQIDLATWRWKYHGAPDGRSLQLVARDHTNGELIGHIGAVLLPGRLPGHPGREGLWAQIGDIMVLERARGDMRTAGVYPQLVRQMQQALQQKAADTSLFAYGFPGLRPFRLGQRLGYYRQIQQCQFTDYSRLPAVAWWHWRRWQPQRVWKLEPHQSLAPADHIDQALAAAPGVVKNARYLQWRYRDHPQRQYTLWWTGTRLQRPTGWLVTAAAPEGKTLTLVDCMLPAAQRLAAVQALLAAQPLQRLQGWLPGLPGVPHPSPIIATEFGTPDFHPLQPSPVFQPGDTDVY